MSRILILLCAALIAGCASTKIYHEECERVENGWVCED